MPPYFNAPENLPFAVALGLFLVIGVVQTVGLLTGANLFDWLDNLLPDMDVTLPGDGVPDLDADALDSLSKFSWIAKAFAWMHFGRVPFIISFMLLLFLFSFIGFNGQLLLREAGVGTLPPWFAAPLALVVTVFPLRWGNALLGRVLPRDETSAVSVRTFIGRVATITIGEATHERAAEARLKDALGNTHYIMVRADKPGAVFAQGEHVLVVSENKGQFTAITVANPHLDTDD